MDESMNRELVQKTELCVRDCMSEQAAGHGIDHVLRVLASARLIQAENGGDLLTIELAALLHDVGDAKFHAGVERSGELSREILGKLNADRGVIDHVALIVDNLSFRKGTDARRLSVEGKIVQDADRLDALGAIGIVRTIEFGAAFNQPFYIPNAKSMKTGVGHFHEKLFKLKSLMNTETARRMAEERESFMRSFLNQFLSEMGESQ